MKRYRIGIDVGGTFTHAVAVNAETLQLAGKIKVPTTHHAAKGVGEGVVQALSQLMAAQRIQPSEIVFVAHSTTQATNSLLEGDVEKVAIVSVGSGWQGTMAKRAARQTSIELAPGRFLRTVSQHVSPNAADSEAELEAFLKKIKAEGVRVVVVSGPFSVEEGTQEKAVAEFVRARGFLCCPTHEVSQLFGIRVRTRTTAINASILPKMMEVADHVETEIKRLGITAPLMIMRSDGGVMSVAEMRKKPVLTLLSGPAAGIAAALRFLKISDGIFVEVGGTSTDISVIKNGRAAMRSAMIGGNRTFLKTLDCRTLGIGGGSVPRARGASLVDVGPRSAHIAGVHYAAFTPAKDASLKASSTQPRDGDPSDYLVFEGQGQRFSLTPTCAANILNLVPKGDPAEAGKHFPGPWREIVAANGLGTLEGFAEKILDASSKKIGATIETLLKEYKLERNWVTLVGGGGGAAALVPHLAKHLGMKYELALEADVISAIGVALGLIREVVERSIVQPTQDDLYRLRAEAREKVHAQGADPASIEVFIEVDAQKNVVRAEAQGSIEFRKTSAQASTASSDLKGLAQSALGLRKKPDVLKIGRSSHLSAVTFSVVKKSLGGLMKSTESLGMVVDSRGVVRLKMSEADFVETEVETVVPQLLRHLERQARFDDGGVSYPSVFVLVADRIIDLSKLQSPTHLAGILEMEVKEIPPTEKAVIITSQQGFQE